MNIIFLYPYTLLFLLILPIIKMAYCKYVRQPSILIPNVSLLKKVIEENTGPQTYFFINCRIFTVLLLLLAHAEPIIIMETLTIRCNNFLIMASFICFLLGIFLQNTLLQKIP
ncbi:MAG: BatA domain-containing protein [Puniceicoccales bacterium]|nr:BatA domain-containing protein [Puniceicoccales bacterium]